MNIFTLIGIIGISMTVLVALISAVMYSLSKAVTNTYAELEAEQTKYKPAVTLGHKIAPEEDAEMQFKQARIEAAKKAAALPRGANMRIGRKGQSTLKPASKNLDADPISSFKIALTQGWRGLGQFDQFQAAATGAQPGAVAAPTKQVKRKLVPGEDYEITEITEEMDPAERRRARIANAKAKSAAYKKLKASGQDMVAAPVQQAAPAAAAAPAQTQEEAAAAAGIEPPEMIEITDDMAPQEVRKARIANAKAKSAYKKALKAAGIDPSAPPAQAAPAPQAAAPAAPSQADAAAAAGIEPPDLIEITDDMEPNEVRKARIANAKAKSAYKKALKAAGIDPSSVNGQAAPATQPAAAPAAETAVPADGGGADAAAAAGIEKPDLIEITDDMEPNEVRKARIANAKAKSAYKKALKAAGIDPSTVEI